MADGHGRILLEQEFHQGFTHELASAYDDNVLSCKVAQTVFGKQDTDTEGRTGRVELLHFHLSEIALIESRQAVHILDGVDVIDEVVLVQLGRERKLEDDTVDALILIERSDRVHEFFGGTVSRKVLFDELDVHFLTGFLLIAHIDLTRGIIANGDNRQAGLIVEIGEHFHGALHFLFPRASNRFSIHDRHKVSPLFFNSASNT